MLLLLGVALEYYYLRLDIVVRRYIRWLALLPGTPWACTASLCIGGASACWLMVMGKSKTRGPNDSYMHRMHKGVLTSQS